MAGYVIHLAVGEQFLKNFPNEIKSYEEFIKGIIYPDNVTDKSQTHYGPKSSKVNLNSFFEERDIIDDFNKGYFLHLVCDYLFYNKFLTVYSKKYIYDDYDILNRDIEIMFNVKIPDCIKDKVFYKDGQTKILNLKDTAEFIKKVASYNLNDIKKEVLNNDKKWLETIILKKI